MPTEREAVMRERKAWIAGQEAACWRDPITEQNAMAQVKYLAANRYPLPSVTRPRVISSYGYDWRFVDEQFQRTRHDKDGWEILVTPPLFVMSQLTASPTEQVPDDS